VDLSGSMNDDTTPGSGSDSDSLVQKVFDDLFGAGHVTYSSAHPEAGISIPSSGTTTTAITADMDAIKTSFPYMNPPIPATKPYSADALAYWTSCISFLKSNSYKISYTNYVKYLMEYARDNPVVKKTPPATSVYTVMSVLNPAYVHHTETVGTGIDAQTFTNFPTREMPTHAVRCAIIAALEVIASRNSTINDTNQRDWVSLVVFDANNSGTDTSHVRVAKSLTSDYTDVMQACVQLQACSGLNNPLGTTDSEGGLICAFNHIKPISKGGVGRENANKVVVFLTDGIPNLCDTLPATVRDFVSHNPSTAWATSGDYKDQRNAALMQAMNLQMPPNNWTTYAVGVGLNGNQPFMDLMANMAGTSITREDGTIGAYPIAKDSNTYETTLTGIFDKIISNPKLRLVQ